MERLSNRPLSTDTAPFYAGAEESVVKRPRFEGIAGVDTRDYNVQTEAPVNTNLRMRSAYEESILHPEEEDALYGMARYDLLFPCSFGTITQISNIGTKTFTLQGINRYLHEAKLEEEEACKQNCDIKKELYDVPWFRQHMSFHGILNSDKSEPYIWGEMEKTVTVLTQGMTRMPSCFDVPAVNPYNRLGLLVKEVCCKERQNYITDSKKPTGVTLPPPKDGYITRVMPSCVPQRYVLPFCHICGLPPVGADPDNPYRMISDNCTHKDNILLYEVNVREGPSYLRLLQQHFKRTFKNVVADGVTDGVPDYMEANKKAGLKPTTQEEIDLLKTEYKRLGKEAPEQLVDTREGYYIPFAMTEKGLTRTQEEPNLYRVESHINEINYQLNSHEEIWLRAS